MTDPLDLARREYAEHGTLATGRWLQWQRHKSAVFDFVVTTLVIAGAVLLSQFLPHPPPPCDNALPWLACDKVGR